MNIAVGDKVLVKEAYPCDATVGIKASDVYLVTRVYSTGGVDIRVPGIEHHYMTGSQVTKVPATKIAVGDFVMRQTGNHMGMHPYDTATVVALTHLGAKLDNYDGHHDVANLRVVSAATPEKASPKAPQLNPGARLPSSLPSGSAERKEYPLYSVLFGYFPAAMNSLAHHAYKSNDKHNPGKPLQWSRNNSDDHAECLLRHLQEGDYEGVMWRAAALLQLAKEKEGAPVAPLATFD